MRRIIALALIIAPTPSMAQEVYQTVDKFSGNVTYFTKWRGQKLEGGSFFSMRYVNFQMLASTISEKSTTPICLAIMTQTEGWVFIKSGDSLILKIDGSEFINLYGDGSLNSRSTLGGDTVSEQALWCGSISQMAKIASAKTVDYRVLGDNQALTGSFDAKFLNDMAAFVRDVPSKLGIVPQASTIGETKPTAVPDAHLTVANGRKPIGITIQPTSLGALLLTVVPQSIAEKADLKSGQIITSINGEDIRGKSAADILEILDSSGDFVLLKLNDGTVVKVDRSSTGQN